MAKRSYLILVPGYRPFTMIMMEEGEDALSVARSIWPTAEVV